MSSLPSDLPKLPKWPFFLFDLLLLATACLIAWNQSGELSGMALISVVACVVLAAVLCVIPFLADYARVQDVALDDRQRSLEALARTVASSAEQIGISAQGIQEISEKTQRALKEAEALPKKLQEKLAELQLRLDSAKDEELEELEREIATLRSSEGEKLESAADKVGKTTAELAKLEAATTKHLQSLTETLAKAQGEAGKVAEKISQSTDDCTSRVVAALARTMQAAQESSRQMLTDEHQKAVDAISQKLDATLETLEVKTGHAAATLGEKIVLLEAAVANLKAASAEVSRTPTPAVPEEPVPAPTPAVEAPAAVLDAPISAPNEPAQAEAPSAQIENSTVPAETTPASPPKRPRKNRRQDEPAQAIQEEVVPEPEPEPALELGLGADLESASILHDANEEEAQPPIEEPAAVETSPAPEPATEPKIVDLPPVAEVEEEPVVEPEPEPQASEPEPTSQEQADFFEESAPEPQADTSISADGATRLIVTAYIGIGNRLYIRGDGPGLSRDKGLPLQFVSIGKWRWESADVTGPVRIRLLKNDQQECQSLGEIVLNPGHQAEVQANF